MFCRFIQLLIHQQPRALIINSGSTGKRITKDSFTWRVNHILVFFVPLDPSFNWVLTVYQLSVSMLRLVLDGQLNSKRIHMLTNLSWKRHTRSNEPLLVTKKHSCHSSNRSFHGDGCLTVTREKISMVMPSRINKNWFHFSRPVSSQEFTVNGRDKKEKESEELFIVNRLTAHSM